MRSSPRPGTGPASIPRLTWSTSSSASAWGGGRRRARGGPGRARLPRPGRQLGPLEPGAPRGLPARQCRRSPDGARARARALPVRAGGSARRSRRGALARAAGRPPRAAARRRRRGPQSRGRRGARRGAAGRRGRAAGRDRARGEARQGLARAARAAARAFRACARHPGRPPRGRPAGPRRRAPGARARPGGRRCADRAARGALLGRPRRGRARDRLALPRRRGVRRAGRPARALRALAAPGVGCYRGGLMRLGWAVPHARHVVVGSTLVLVAAAAAPAAEVRVLSGPGAASTVTIGAEPGVAIEDRTPGAKPAGAPSGPASSGETFTGEITIFLSGFTVLRPAVIDVADPVVSTVRLFPEAAGTTVTVFVRQPVTYSVSRPSALGEIRIEVHTKTRPLTVVGVTPRGRPRIAKPKPTGETEVAVDAESLAYDQASNTLTARGGVTLTRGDTTLTADEVVFDRTNQVAEARGHVVLNEPQATVQGDFAHLNLHDESGWVENADADMHPGEYYLRAGRLDKQGGPQYSVADGVCTSCQCGGLEAPSWSIAGRRTDITLQGKGIVRHMTFLVKDVPVFYFPYFVFPANTQRESGFLMPRLGYSNRRGFQYEQPFFWAISKSTDATIATDLESAARVGIIGEYRYTLSREAHGAFTPAYYNA